MDTVSDRWACYRCTDRPAWRAWHLEQAAPYLTDSIRCTASLEIIPVETVTFRTVKLSAI